MTLIYTAHSFGPYLRSKRIVATSKAFLTEMKKQKEAGLLTDNNAEDYRESKDSLVNKRRSSNSNWDPAMYDPTTRHMQY
jgi:hypothetical protein